MREGGGGKKGIKEREGGGGKVGGVCERESSCHSSLFPP